MNEVSAKQMPVIIIPTGKGGNAPENQAPMTTISYAPYYQEQMANNLGEIGENPNIILERNPVGDVYGAPSQMVGSNLMIFKAPSPQQVMDGIKIATTVIGLLTEAVRSGRELYDVLADWFGSHPETSKEEKAQTMKMAFAMAKEVENIDNKTSREAA